jgi:RNA polymerase sigma-70 factor (ECF subfamily)
MGRGKTERQLTSLQTAKPPVQSDLELVGEVKQGNKKSFAELVHRHQRQLLRLTLRFVRDQGAAEDITQEAFIKAYQKIDTFEGRASFKSWLFQIGLNTARNRLRARPDDHYSLDQVQFGTVGGAESGLMKGDLRTVIRNEVDALPERQKIALTLRIFEDLSFKEIADIMECPYDTAKANYRHALMKLKDRLETSEAREALADFDREQEGTGQVQFLMTEAES